MCVEKECETKQCPAICGDLVKSKILGHNSHSPKTGRYYRYVVSQDVKGQHKTQYFILSLLKNQKRLLKLKCSHI